MRRTRWTQIATLALVGMGAAVVAAQAAPVTLPLVAPSGADPLVADFIEVCSQSLMDFGGAAALAEHRGWTANEEDPLSRAAAAAFGQASFVKPFGEEDALLLLQRAAFPHVLVQNCSLQLFGEVPASFDPNVISTVEEIEGWSLPIMGQQVGRWSFIDSTDEVVTLSLLPLGSDGLYLTMARSERLSDSP